MATNNTTSTNNKLYVGNIDYNTTKPELTELFKDYQIDSIEIPVKTPKFKTGKAKPRAKGYVFITFNESVKDLDEIIEKFTNYEFKDRKIYLNRPVIKEPTESTTNTSTTSETTKPAKQTTKPAAKETKEKIPLDQGIKSTDTVYLKNLDFNTDAKELRSYFTDAGEEVKWVSVPFKRLPGFVLKKLAAQGKTIEKRNKGYAFVKFKVPEGQSIDDIVSKYQDKEFKDRQLQLSVAVDVRGAENEDGNADEAADEE